MTTLTADSRRTGPAHRPDRGAERLTFGRVVASEWVKLRTLRSTWWTLGVTVVLMVGIAALVAWGMTQGDEAAPPGMGLIAVTAGTQMAQLAVAVLGVLIITGEYTTGMVRSTFAAVPTRLPALAAKGIVLAVTVFVVGAISTALSYLVTLPFVSGTSLAIDLGDSDTLRALVGVPLYLTAIALLALGFGALLRHSAGALAAVLGLLLVIENVFALIPLRFFEVVSPYLPATAGSQIMMPSDFAFTDPDALGAWPGYGVMLAWVAVVIAVAAVLMRRRDA